MMNFLSNWFKSAEEQRQEALSAYLDNALTPPEKERFERQIAGDAGLQAELEQWQQIKSNFQQMPRRRAPRNFTLNPNVYGRPEPQPLIWLYPTMRAATVLMAFFFVLALSIELLGSPMAAEQSVNSVAMEGVVEITRVVSERTSLDEPMGESFAIEVEPEDGVAMDSAATFVAPEEADEDVVEEALPGIVVREAEQVTEPAAAAVPPPAAAPQLSPQPQIDLRATEPMITGEIEFDTEALPLSETELLTVADKKIVKSRSLAPLRLAQISLGALFISLLLITFTLRRRLYS